MWGSLYYIDDARYAMQRTLLGQILEAIFVFWPYVLIRPWFPVTRFSDAGSSSAGRSEKNERFYQIGTTAIKIFYLWAKYYLAFFINFVVYLDLIRVDGSDVDGSGTDGSGSGYDMDEMMKQKQLIQGLFLLNCGTISISVFLHTLRFKKVFPPRLTFSLYLGQIYA